MSLDFRIVIPARYAAERLPGKPLRQIHGKTMIEWVHRAALAADAREVVVATDDERIADAVSGFGGRCCLTSSSHRSGTDRIVEVTQQLGWHEQDIVVNLQGDEPLMPAQNITQVAANLAARDCAMATLHKDIDAAQARDPNLVKLVLDNDGYALYFSRAPIPYRRGEAEAAYRGHIGIYAYRVGFVRRYAALAPSPLEIAESLEQLRALHYGHRIHSESARAVPGPGIDTEQDLARVSELLGDG